MKWLFEHFMLEAGAVKFDDIYPGVT